MIGIWQNRTGGMVRHRDRPSVTLDVFVVMPNHIHGIMMITETGRGTALPCPYIQLPY